MLELGVMSYEGCLFESEVKETDWVLEFRWIA